MRSAIVLYFVVAELDVVCCFDIAVTAVAPANAAATSTGDIVAAVMVDAVTADVAAVITSAKADLIVCLLSPLMRSLSAS